MNLKESVSKYIEDGGYLDEILFFAILKNDISSLKEIIRLVDSDHGGGSYKWEIKYTAAFAVLFWEEEGIEELYNIILKNPSHPNISVISTVLSYAAAGKIENLPFKFNSYSIDIPNKIEKFKTEKIKIKAQSALIDLMHNVETEDKFPISLITGLTKPIHSEEAQEQYFAALVMRWFHFSNYSTEKYKDLIYKENLSEEIYHKFLNENPFLLEAFHSKIWSKPRFGELLQPDFVIKAIDNNYTIIELEKPSLQIITKNGNLSSHATHAKKQALEYREWAISNNTYAKERFSDIWRPSCLVIIGLESKLTESQKVRLKQENESTQGILKIVGFDWILNRAQATFENLIKYGFKQTP
ncbi:Shedu anti-phage system protein SduA domain-containing protein [Flavobacterium sp. UW10123]|uniref:Shedu anti-phage system protein SduA domain-containing protein n=1 Tax=Flavobacterium sp. UW10123 TaxID=3230800 RepID=UPI00339143A6